MGHNFGNEKGNPALNNAIVDFEEIRVAGGISWNIRPLLALNVEGGYMMDRTIDYHNNDLSSSSGKAPYVLVNVRWLVQVIKDDRSIPAQMRDLEREFPWMRPFLRSHR